MAQERNALKVGLVTLFVVGTFFVILLWISQRVGGEMQTITIRFKSSPDMPTLVPGSYVLVGGHKVGKVTEVKLVAEDVRDARRDSRTSDGDARRDSRTSMTGTNMTGTSMTGTTDTGRQAASGTPRQAYYVHVKADIRSDLKLKTDCKVIAEGPPLGGDGLVKIDVGTASDEIDLKRPIEGSDPAGFSAILAALQSEFDGDNPGGLLGRLKSQLDPDAPVSLMAKLLKSLDDINQMTATLSRELQPGQKAALLAKIHEVADNINATTGVLRAEFDSQQPTRLLGKVQLAMDTVNDGLETITQLLKTNEAPISRTIHHVETTAANIASETDPARVDSLLSHFKEAGRRLNASLADINQVTDMTRQIVVLNRENVHKLLINLKESSDHIKTGVKYVLRHPWRVFNEPSITETKQQAIFDAARSFTEAATRIDDASAQLRALAELYEGDIAADNPDLARIVADLQRTRQNYKKAEAELWRQLGVQ
jgi:ABC-type transporter Mla subunit MlaD